MVRSCAACKCTNRASKGNKISFHIFPADPDLRKQWIIATGRENFKPSKFTYLCAQHFKEEDYIIQFGRRKLKAGVVPSVFQSTHIQKKTRQRKTSTSTKTNYCNVNEEITIKIEGFLSDKVNCDNKLNDQNDSLSALYFCARDMEERFTSNILQEKITIHVDNVEKIIPDKVNVYKSEATQNMTESCITDENDPTENMENFCGRDVQERFTSNILQEFFTIHVNNDEIINLDKSETEEDGFLTNVIKQEVHSTTESCITGENDPTENTEHFCGKDVQQRFTSNILQEFFTIHVDNDETTNLDKVKVYKSETEDGFLSNLIKQEVHSPTESCISDENGPTEDMETLLPPRKRRLRMYVGDFCADDMNCPKKAKLMFEIAKKTIVTKNKQLRNLRKRLARLQKRIDKMETLLEH